MRFATIHRNTELVLVALSKSGDHLIDLKRAAINLNLASDCFEDLLTLIESGDLGLKLTEKILAKETDLDSIEVRFSLQDIKWAPPLNPPRLLCFSVYEQHMKQAFEAVIRMKAGKLIGSITKRLGLVRMPSSFFKKPIYYKGNNLSLNAHLGTVPWPKWTNLLDYEMELGVVIGRRGKNISTNEAMDYVFGYTCFNDFSARDKMMEEIPWGGVGPLKGKDFDGGNSIGPWVVTPDEITDPYDLKMTVRVNGEERGLSSTCGMSHPISRMIEVASDEEFIVPGMVIGTGAAGNGCGIESLRFLQPGDCVEIEIDQIGSLKNLIGEKP